ncbi:MAG TPA: hypothetical protein VFS88_07665 [Micavibrio sp.]|nr:hypothetical protein [Micavibrio sp.]
MNNTWMYFKNLLIAAFKESVSFDCNTSLQLDKIKQNASAKPVTYDLK